MSRGPRPDPRRAKLHHNYTVAEAAMLFAVHRNTVNAWRKAGLRSFTAGRIRLILGEDLRAFLEKRRRSRRSPLRPGQMYCMACRDARTPDPALIEWASMSDSGGGNLRALCPHCGAFMHRKIGRAGPLAVGFQAMATPADSHLSNANGPCVNSARKKST